MREYIVKKEDISNAQKASVDIAPWREYPYKPMTNAYMAYNENEIVIKLETDEKNLRQEQTEDNSNVCFDSCMEVFIKPNKDDDRYFNFEINPRGTLHLGLGASRNNRVHPDDSKSIFKINSFVKNGIWTVEFVIPFFFVEKYTGFTKECSGNFFKCGEKTDHVHFCVWNNVETPEPDYHQSCFFGKFIFE